MKLRSLLVAAAAVSTDVPSMTIEIDSGVGILFDAVANGSFNDFFSLALNPWDFNATTVSIAFIQKVQDTMLQLFPIKEIVRIITDAVVQIIQGLVPGLPGASRSNESQLVAINDRTETADIVTVYSPTLPLQDNTNQSESAPRLMFDNKEIHLYPLNVPSTTSTPVPNSTIRESKDAEASYSLRPHTPHNFLDSADSQLPEGLREALEGLAADIKSQTLQRLFEMSLPQTYEFVLTRIMSEPSFMEAMVTKLAERVPPNTSAME